MGPQRLPKMSTLRVPESTAAADAAKGEGRVRKAKRAGKGAGGVGVSLPVLPQQAAFTAHAAAHAQHGVHELGEPEWAELVRSYGLHKGAQHRTLLRDHVDLAASDGYTADTADDADGYIGSSPSQGSLPPKEELPLRGARNWVAFLHEGGERPQRRV